MAFTLAKILSTSRYDFPSASFFSIAYPLPRAPARKLSLLMSPLIIALTAVNSPSASILAFPPLNTADRNWATPSFVILALPSLIIIDTNLATPSAPILALFSPNTAPANRVSRWLVLSALSFLKKVASERRAEKTLLSLGVLVSVVLITSMPACSA